MTRNGNGRRTLTTAYGVAVTIAHDQRAGDLIPVLVDGEHVADLRDESYNGMAWYSLWIDGEKVAARKSQSSLAGQVGWIVSRRQRAA